MEKLAIIASIPEQVVGNLFNMLEKEGTAEQLGKACVFTVNLPTMF